MPGLVVDFAVIFSVPTGTKPPTVYTLENRDQRNASRAAGDVRVMFSRKVVGRRTNRGRHSTTAEREL